jgi:hypothetical protein
MFEQLKDYDIFLVGDHFKSVLPKIYFKYVCNV